MLHLDWLQGFPEEALQMVPYHLEDAAMCVRLLTMHLEHM
jgi:hypothetical protein